MIIVEEEQEIAEAMLLAERLSKEARKLSLDEKIDIQIMITALVWAAIGLGITHSTGTRDSLKLGLHFAIESALEEDKTLH